MKKLNEEVELAVLKALEGASLSDEELQDLSDVTLGDLLADHGLDYVLADKVMSHVDYEIEKQKKQNLISLESIQKTVKNNSTFTRHTGSRFRKLVSNLIKEEMNR